MQKKRQEEKFQLLTLNVWGGNAGKGGGEN